MGGLPFGGLGPNGENPRVHEAPGRRAVGQVAGKKVLGLLVRDMESPPAERIRGGWCSTALVANLAASPLRGSTLPRSAAGWRGHEPYHLMLCRRSGRARRSNTVH